jgi:hypothetical protein
VTRGGSPISAISDCLGRHWLSVKCLLAKTKALPKEFIPERKKGSGHPAMIKSYALKVLERYLKKNPRSTAHIVKQEVPEVACLPVHYINYLILMRLKIPTRMAAQKPLLMKKLKQRVRLAFAKKYKHWTEKKWSKVMFSDESTFRCLRATRSRVHWPTGLDRFDSCYTVKTDKHPESVMVWGCFTGNGESGGSSFSPRTRQ